MQKIPDRSTADRRAAAQRALAAHWFPGGAEVTQLVSGGFSGAPVFLVRPAAARPHVLKVLAASTSPERAGWIHRAISHIRGCSGGEVIPAVRESVDGHTLVVTDDGRLCEMLEYVDGVTTSDPAPSQIASAMRALAHVHSAAALLAENPPMLAVSPGWTERVSRARELSDRPWRSLLNAPPPASEWATAVMPHIAVACDHFEAGGGSQCVAWLATTVPAPLRCQFVLRDVWSEHVFFDSDDRDRVAAIIDLHAAGIDTPATDVARLLGSWLPPRVSTSWWATAIEAYANVLPMGPCERRLVPLLAATGIIFGLDNWFRWTLVEGRSFPEHDRVVSRLHRLVSSLPGALNVLHEARSPAGLTLENSSP